MLFYISQYCSLKSFKEKIALQWELKKKNSQNPPELGKYYFSDLNICNPVAMTVLWLTQDYRLNWRQGQTWA